MHAWSQQSLDVYIHFHLLPSKIEEQRAFLQREISPNDVAKICSVRVSLLLRDKSVYLMFSNLLSPFNLCTHTVDSFLVL